MLVRFLCLLFLLITLSGCLATGGQRYVDPHTLATYVQKKSSVYEPFTTYIGPEIQSGLSNYRLRSFVDNETGLALHQIYVHTTYQHSEWVNWERARSDEGHSLEFTSIDTKVEGCTAWRNCVYTEQFGVKIDDDYMRSRAGIGGSVKVYAHNGSEAVLTLPPNYIQAQLLAIDPLTVSPGFTPAAVQSVPPSE